MKEEMTDSNQNKLAVVFPGIGYHVDKPLLFHTRKLLRELGYEVADVNYTGFPSGIKGNPQKMKEAFDIALLQSEDILKDVDMAKADDLIFVSKSIGTAVAAAYAGNHGLTPRHIYFTPIAEAFDYIVPRSGIAFHGTSDPWADTEIITGKCSEYEIDLFITNDANHSLEIGDTLKDIQELYTIMDTVKRFISSEG